RGGSQKHAVLPLSGLRAIETAYRLTTADGLCQFALRHLRAAGDVAALGFGIELRLRLLCRAAAAPAGGSATGCRAAAAVFAAGLGGLPARFPRFRALQAAPLLRRALGARS